LAITVNNYQIFIPTFAERIGVTSMVSSFGNIVSRQSSSNYYLNANFMLVENSFWESEPRPSNRQLGGIYIHDLIAKRL